MEYFKIIQIDPSPVLSAPGRKHEWHPRTGSPSVPGARFPPQNMRGRAGSWAQTGVAANMCRALRREEHGRHCGGSTARIYSKRLDPFDGGLRQRTWPERDCAVYHASTSRGTKACLQVTLKDCRV